MGWFTDLFDEKPKDKSKSATVKVEEVKEEPKVVNFDITGKLTYEFVDRINDAEYQKDYKKWEESRNHIPIQYLTPMPHRYIVKFTYDIFANGMEINNHFILGLSKNDEREALIMLYRSIESLKDGSGEELMDEVKRNVKKGIIQHYENLKIEDLRARLDDHFNEDYITLNFQVKVEQAKL